MTGGSSPDGNTDEWMGNDTYSVRWEGQILADKDDAEYILYTRAGDGVRLWVNGSLIIEEWNTHPFEWQDNRENPITLYGEQY